MNSAFYALLTDAGGLSPAATVDSEGSQWGKGRGGGRHWMGGHPLSELPSDEGAPMKQKSPFLWQPLRDAQFH